MKQPARQTLSPELKTGLIAGLCAYVMWGFFPVYFKVTDMVSASEVLAHRIVWSLPFGLLMIAARKQGPQLWAAFKNPTLLKWLTVSSIAMTLNWGVYIWAVQDNQIFQASLGYYINPLIYMMVGVIFFGERMSRLQGSAVVLAVIGVTILTIYGGIFPGISLFLAISFTVYGVIRKRVEVGALPGLMVEILVMFTPALAFLVYLGTNEELKFTHGGGQLDLLLLLAGPITVLPLVAFAIAARKLPFSTIGFLQFVGPTIQFLCGLYYGEVFTPAHAWCFGLIWLSVLVYSYGSYRLRPNAAPS